MAFFSRWDFATAGFLILPQLLIHTCGHRYYYPNYLRKRAEYVFSF